MRSLSVAYFLMTVFAFPANAADNTYDIQPGDTLELHVVGVPELTYRTTVSPQGLVSFPLVEDVVAAGRMALVGRIDGVHITSIAAMLASTWAAVFVEQVRAQVGTAEGPNALIEATRTQAKA